MYREVEIRQAHGLTAGGARKIKTLQCLFCLFAPVPKNYNNKKNNHVV